MTHEDSENLLRFVAAAIDAVRGSKIGNDWDGGDIQDAMLRCGIIAPVRVTEACGDNCQCAEWDGFPQDCLRLTALGMRASLRSPKGDAQSLIGAGSSPRRGAE